MSLSKVEQPEASHKKLEQAVTSRKQLQTNSKRNKEKLSSLWVTSDVDRHSVILNNIFVWNKTLFWQCAAKSNAIEKEAIQKKF